MIKQKLNSSFYVYIVFLAICLITFPGTIFGILTDTVVPENGEAFNIRGKILLVSCGTLITLFSAISIITAIRQVIIGHAFIIDGEGIHSTLSVFGSKTIAVLLPIKKIPYDAIESAYMDGSNVTLILDKEKIEVNSLIKPFVRKKYKFVYQFAKYDEKSLRELFNRYTNNRYFISKEDLKNRIIDIIPSTAEITTYEFDDEHYIENIVVIIKYNDVEHVFDASLGEIYYNGNSVFEKTGKYSDKESMYPELLKVIEQTFNN